MSSKMILLRIMDASLCESVGCSLNAAGLTTRLSTAFRSGSGTEHRQFLMAVAIISSCGFDMQVNGLISCRGVIIGVHTDVPLCFCTAPSVCFCRAEHIKGLHT